METVKLEDWHFLNNHSTRVNHIIETGKLKFRRGEGENQFSY